jgi:hypothetical protein
VPSPARVGKRLQCDHYMRGRFMEVGEQAFTRDWFSRNVATWEKTFAEHKGKPNLRYLEIGSFEGRSTSWLLTNILTDPSCVIECADLFTPNDQDSDDWQDDYFPRFLQNTAAWRDRVVVHTGPSFETLSRIRGEFDAIYVDGWHTAYGALADAVMSWPRLKVGGLMVFDDYLWVPSEYEKEKKLSWPQRKFAQLRGYKAKHWAAIKVIEAHPSECPKPGIDGFLKSIDGYYEVLSSGYQIAIRKTRDFSHG